MSSYLIRQNNQEMCIQLICNDGSYVEFPVALELGDSLDDSIYRKWCQENLDLGTPHKDPTL